MIAQRFKEIDKRSISVIVNFDLAQGFGKEYTGRTAENLDIDLMRRQ
jgi:hypothetical protein